MSIVDYFCIFWGGEAPGETQTHLCEVGENFWENGKANFLARWRLHRQNFSRARTSEKPCKGRLNKKTASVYARAGQSIFHFEFQKIAYRLMLISLKEKQNK